MAAITQNQEYQYVALFNSTLETGIRALILLNTVYPQAYDLTTLTWLDYLVVHTEDIEGPPSLHPDIPQRNGELLVRRKLIKDSLMLMYKLHLVNYITNCSGISYQASEEAPPLLDLLQSKYTQELKSRAKWLARNVCNLDEKEMKKLITSKIGRWDIEFHNENNQKDMNHE